MTSSIPEAEEYPIPEINSAAQVLNLVSNRRTVLASTIIFLGAIMLLTACGNESYQVQDLSSLPRQAVSERTYRTPVILSTDTLAFTWSRVRSARIDDSGNIYVHDTWTQSIVKFDAEGQFVAQLGKKGPGPGEFMSMSGFDVRGDGTVFVSDAGKITVFDPDGQFVRKGSNREALRNVAVNDEHLVSAYFYGTQVFSAVSDDLETRFKYGRFAGDPYENSPKVMGLFDGHPNGIILVTQFTGILLGFDLKGRQTMGIRTIETPDIQMVRWEDGGLKGGHESNLLINATDSHIYLISTAYPGLPDEFGIDIYSTKTGQYEYSFPLPNQTCGPRFIDDHEMISACFDGEVLRSKIRFE